MSWRTGHPCVWAGYNEANHGSVVFLKMCPGVSGHVAHVDWQDGAPYPLYAGNADVPEGETEGTFCELKVATDHVMT